VDPVEEDEGVALGLGIAQAIGLVVLAGLFPVVGVWIVRDLEVVLAVLRVEAELVLRSLVAQERDEAALRVCGVVEDLGDGCGEAVVGA